MKPFSGLYTRCPKCDAPGGWIETIFCPVGYPDCGVEIKGEHLHRSCSRCGWHAVEQVADAKERTPCQ